MNLVAFQRLHSNKFLDILLNSHGILPLSSISNFQIQKFIDDNFVLDFPLHHKLTTNFLTTPK